MQTKVGHYLEMRRVVITIIIIIIIIIIIRNGFLPTGRGSRSTRNVFWTQTAAGK